MFTHNSEMRNPQHHSRLISERLQHAPVITCKSCDYLIYLTLHLTPFLTSPRKFLEENIMNLTSMLPLGHYWRPWMTLGLILLLSACVPTAGPTSGSPAPTTGTEEPMTETVTDTATMTNTDVLTDSATMSNTAPMSDLSAVEQQLVERAMEIVATEAGVTTADLTLINLQPMEWPDSSLGCPQPGTMYMQVITPGYQLTLEDVSGTTYNIHTGLDPSGQVILCQETEGAMSTELTRERLAVANGYTDRFCQLYH